MSGVLHACEVLVMLNLGRIGECGIQFNSFLLHLFHDQVKDHLTSTLLDNASLLNLLFLRKLYLDRNHWLSIFCCL